MTKAEIKSNNAAIMDSNNQLAEANQSSKPTITTLSPQAESYQRRPIGFDTEDPHQYDSTYGSIITTANSITIQL
jgi:hypothetical protein